MPDEPVKERWAAEEYIFGRNPVLEALRSGAELNRLWVAKGSVHGSIGQIRTLARERGIPIQEVERIRLDLLAPNANHQGVVATRAAWRYADLDDLVVRVEGEQDPLLVVLDGIEDPHNLGSILRTCDAAGVRGVIIPWRRAVGITQTVARVSAGAVEYVPVARVSNIPMTLEILKKNGFWVCGAHQEAPEAYFRTRLEGPLAVVIGGEGKGLGRLVAERCDFLVRIPMLGQVGSLNAAVAAAVLVFEAQRQRTLGLSERRPQEF